MLAFGNSSGEPTTFNVGNFYRRYAPQLYGFIIFHQLARDGGAGRDLQALADRLDRRMLDPQVGFEGSWHDPCTALDALYSRQVNGKAVLRVAQLPGVTARRVAHHLSGYG